MSDLPKFGDGLVTERNCTRDLGDRLCEQRATVHVIWKIRGMGVEQGSVCAEHAAEALRLWKPFATHPLGPCCAMPGSLYYADENECRYDDGLPTAEPVRAVAQEATA